jgi:hypothetical protein
MSLSINKPKYLVVTTNPPPLLPTGAQDTQVLTNVQGVNTWTYPQYNYKGSNLFPQDNFDTTSIPVLSPPAPSYKHGGGALSPNGNIYFGSFGAFISDGIRKNMKLNPYTNTVSYIPTTQEYGFGGTVCANNGKIYALPWTGTPNNIQVIDSLNNDALSFLDVSGLASTDYRGLVNFNNFIYAIPHNSENILRIDPINNTVSIDASGINITNYPVMGTNTAKYSGGVVGSDGNIYCIPNTARRVLRYNPVTKAITFSATPDVSGYNSGVLGPNSRIYMMPSSAANNIGIVNINTFSTAGQAVDISLTSFTDASGGTTLISSLGGGTRFISGILAPNDKIYCIPYGGARFLSVDTSNNTASQIFPLTNTNVGSDAYGGAVLAPNGKIYVCPLNVDYVGIIKTGLPSQQGWMYAPSFNKSP